MDFLWTAYVKYKHNEGSPAVLLCRYGPIKRVVAVAYQPAGLSPFCIGVTDTSILHIIYNLTMTTVYIYAT